MFRKLIFHDSKGYWEKSPSGKGIGGAKETSSSTGILLSRSHHPQGGTFTYILKNKFSISEISLNKDRSTTYIH